MLRNLLLYASEISTQAASSSEHLLKHTERIKGQVHERLNIIFIDPYFITRPVPNDNKFVDCELDTFPFNCAKALPPFTCVKQPGNRQ